MWALLPLVAAVGACEDFGGKPTGQGELRWILEGEGPSTRASAEIPDTNDFLLKVSDAHGKVNRNLRTLTGGSLVWKSRHCQGCGQLTPAHTWVSS